MTNKAPHFFQNRTQQLTAKIKTARYLFISMFLLWTMIFPAYKIKAQTTSATQADAPSIWLITDLHYMSPSLTDQGKRYQSFQKQAAGIDYDFGPDRLEALLRQIEGEHPQAIIVAGDLTSNGEYQSMVDLATYFTRMEALGTQVFVIPGNHDIHNGWAVGFEGERAVKVDQTSPEDFVELFKDFGYQDALSRDPHSLSYLAEVSDNWQVLMLDTNVYSDKAGKGQSESRGQTKPETLEWAGALLSQTPQDTLVLPVMHHGALSHFQGEYQETTATEASPLQQLLAQHQIPITLTGHLHSQHITSLMVDDTPLHEVVTTSFSIYPGKIGAVTFDQQHVTYQQIGLDMESWLGPERHLDYLAHLKALQTNSTHVKIFDTLYNDATLKPHTQEISEVFQALNLSFFMGSIREDWPALEVALTNIQPYIEGTDYRFFNGYLDLLLSTKDYSQTELIVDWQP